MPYCAKLSLYPYFTFIMTSLRDFHLLFPACTPDAIRAQGHAQHLYHFIFTIFCYASTAFFTNLLLRYNIPSQQLYRVFFELCHKPSTTH
jgi:hypothetical protein